MKRCGFFALGIPLFTHFPLHLDYSGGWPFHLSDRRDAALDGVIEAAGTREIGGKSAGGIAGAARACGPNDEITVVKVRRAEA